MANYTRLLFTSNNDWAVPVGIDERRFLVLEVKNERANDRTYFEPIFKQMLEQGGVEAMLHELRHREIKSNLRKPPETDALKEQRWQTLDGIQRWLVTIARDGGMTDPLNNEDHEFREDYRTSIPCTKVLRIAKEAVGGRYEARTVATVLGQLLKEVGVKRKRVQKPGSNNERPWVYIFPRANLLRRAVEKC